MVAIRPQKCTQKYGKSQLAHNRSLQSCTQSAAISTRDLCSGFHSPLSQRGHRRPARRRVEIRGWIVLLFPCPHGSKRPNRLTSAAETGWRCIQIAGFLFMPVTCSACAPLYILRRPSTCSHCHSDGDPRERAQQQQMDTSMISFIKI